MNTTLVNATPCEVAYLDGTRETISLARLTIRQVYTWAKLLHDKDTPALVSLCSGKPVEWLDTLADESFGVLGNKCIELVFPRALALSKTDPVMANLLGPVLAESVALLRTADETTRGLTSSAPLPAPVPSASAAVIGNAAST